MRKAWIIIRGYWIKWGELQIGVALFTTHGPVESDKYPAQKVYDGMKKTFRYLSEYGEKRGVRLLLTNTRFRIADTVDKQIKNDTRDRRK